MSQTPPTPGGSAQFAQGRRAIVRGRAARVRQAPARIHPRIRVIAPPATRPSTKDEAIPPAAAPRLSATRRMPLSRPTAATAPASPGLWRRLHETQAELAVLLRTGRSRATARKRRTPGFRVECHEAHRYQSLGAPPVWRASPTRPNRSSRDSQPVRPEDRIPIAKGPRDREHPADLPGRGRADRRVRMEPQLRTTPDRTPGHRPVPSPPTADLPFPAHPPINQ